MIWWIIATICAFFVKGLCGFANTLVFTTILSFGNNNINISPVELILGYPSNAILAWKEWRSIKWSICIPLAILVIVGSIPGVLFLKNSNTTIIKIVFGFVIICIGIAIVLIPLMLLGLALGMLSSKILDEKWVKKIVIVMLIISGLALVISSVA